MKITGRKPLPVATLSETQRGDWWRQRPALIARFKVSLSGLLLSPSSVLRSTQVLSLGLCSLLLDQRRHVRLVSMRGSLGIVISFNQPITPFIKASESRTVNVNLNVVASLKAGLCVPGWSKHFEPWAFPARQV